VDVLLPTESTSVKLGSVVGLLVDEHAFEGPDAGATQFVLDFLSGWRFTLASLVKHAVERILRMTLHCNLSCCTVLKFLQSEKTSV
jgi:hypothetical protein